ncbi:MAG: peptidylprolyl isomerase [Bacteroidota bacterium]|nr:peptidylprolyl isomerase [Bacteroidota bacterium]
MRIPICILAFTLMFYNNISGHSDKRKERIIIRTELGEIHVRLDLKRAPVTSLNFLRYIDAGLYDSTCFYRVVRMDNQPDNKIRIEVIQGGRYEDEDKGFPPIMHETTSMTGIRHRDGTISMARSEPGTATSEFFICIGDQPELDYGGKRNPDGQGFAAFGKVTKGMDVVKRIHSISAPGQYLGKPVLIHSVVREF